MKKTINVAIGGCSFTIDEDAYNTLNDYLERFKAALDSTSSSAGVMDELEVRIADLLKGRLGGRQVVDLVMTQSVIGELVILKATIRLKNRPARKRHRRRSITTAEQTEKSQQESCSEIQTERSLQEYALESHCS